MEGPRAARPEELDHVSHFVDAIFRSGTDQHLTADYPLVFSQQNLQNVRILFEGDRIVSHAALLPRVLIHENCRFRTGMICAVATDPEFRHRGLASRVVEDCLVRMKTEGCDFGILWTGVPGAYFRTGWEVTASNGWAYLVPAEHNRRFRQTHEVRFYRAESDLEQLMAIHESFPFRVARSRADYESLYTLPKIKVWVAEQGMTIAGYVVLAEGYNKVGIVEWGGSLAALESLLAQVLPRTNRQPLQVLVPSWPNSMTELLCAQGSQKRITMEEAEASGLKMVRIVSLKGLLGGLVPHIQRRLADHSGVFALSVSETNERASVQIENGEVSVDSSPASDQLTLSVRQLTNLIFGPHKPSSRFELRGEFAKVLDRLFPFPFHIWMLDYV